MRLNNKIILVTGGAGFIGSHIVEHCLDYGAEKVISFDNLTGVVNNNHAHIQNNSSFEFVKGDIRDYETTKKYVEQADIIFNEAASKLVVSLKNPFIDVQTNVVGNFNILEIVRKSKKNPRIIHASTGSVFGSSDKPFKEDSPKNPSTVYGISKLAAEKYHLLYFKEYGIKTSVLRYFHVFGPRQEYQSEAGVINIFLSRILQGKPPQVCGTGEQIRCFTFVKDVVAANFLLLKKNSSIGQDYNVASKTRISIIELAKLLIKKYGQNGMKPEFIAHRQGENMRPIPDTTKIEKLGFKESISFEQGLEITKDWIEEDIKHSRL
ncbi:MAG: SDR family NAD(P)-dependent oxidoreductase [Candidatus Woesearchaeota archaeon]